MTQSRHNILVLALKVKPLEGASDCFNVLSRNLFEAFLELSCEPDSNISVVEYKTYNEYLDDGYTKEFDCVVLISYLGMIESLDIIRKKTGCKKLITFNEVPFDTADFSFVCNKDFMTDSNKKLYVHFPFNKNLLCVKEKETSAILVDHYWERYLGTHRDRTGEIIGWLANVKDKFKIYRMVRFAGESDTLSNFEIPVRYTGYCKYLENTGHIETYVITHKEGFPWGVVDMAARGTRIITPPNFIPKCMIDSFNIGVFDNVDEFMVLIHRPRLTPCEISEHRQRCADFLDVARMVNVKIKELLS